MHKKALGFMLAALLALPLSALFAQEPTPSDSIPLRVQVVLSRFDGEKRLSNMPYTLLVNATRDERRGPTSLRMGVEVPIPTTTKDASGSVVPSYTYRNVGTNIDCAAQILGDGRYRLTLTVEQSSIFPDDPKKSGGGSGNPPVMFRAFKANFAVALKDGQTAQNTSATDPVNGEVLKVDVTMNVIK